MADVMRVDSSPVSDAGRLVLRLVLGLLLLCHGVSKIKGGDAMNVGMVEQAGLPGVLGHFVYLGEVVAPVLLLVGVWSRLAGLVAAGNMVVALLLVHRAQFGQMTPQGGWALELQAFYLCTALAIALLGAGRYSIGGAHGRWN